MKIEISEQGKIPVKAGGTGLFFEDLNYGLDGGLYAEMLENRNFEAKDVHGEWDKYIVEDDGGYAWSPYPSGADVALKVKTDRPLFPENPHYMRVVTSAPMQGVCNKAYDGLYLKRKMGYKVSFYARSYSYKGKALVQVRLGGEVLLEKKVKIKPDGHWKKYAFRLKCKKEADGASFCFLLSKRIPPRPRRTHEGDEAGIPALPRGMRRRGEQPREQVSLEKFHRRAG